MSGGGGGGSQSTQVKLPDYIKNASYTAVNRQMGMLDDPYQAYPGQRQASLSPDRLQAWQQIRNMQGGADPYYQSSLGQLSGLLGSAVPITASQVTGAAGQFMNPYEQQVVNPAQQALIDQFNTQRGIIGGQAANVGAFGGDRQGVMEGVMGAETSKAAGQLVGNLRYQGYNQALDNAMNLLQGNQQLGFQATQLLPQIATGLQQQRATDTGLLSNIGQAQQQYNQAGLDIAYQNWLDQQGYEQSQIDQLVATIGATPYGQKQVVSGGGPSKAASAATGALGGAASGAAVGTMIYPGIGTAVGAVGGALVGGLAGGLL